MDVVEPFTVGTVTRLPDEIVAEAIASLSDEDRCLLRTHAQWVQPYESAIAAAILKHLPASKGSERRVRWSKPMEAALRFRDALIAAHARRSGLSVNDPSYTGEGWTSTGGWTEPGRRSSS